MPRFDDRNNDHSGGGRPAGELRGAPAGSSIIHTDMAYTDTAYGYGIYTDGYGLNTDGYGIYTDGYGLYTDGYGLYTDHAAQRQSGPGRGP